MFALKLTYRGKSNILPYRWAWYETALKAAANRRDMVEEDVRVQVIEVDDEPDEPLSENISQRSEADGTV